MTQCWCASPVDLPSFSLVRHQLEALLSRGCDYVDLDNIDAPLTHSQPDDSPSSLGGRAGALGPPALGDDDTLDLSAFELDELALNLDLC